jgi:hypothetical protein
MIKRVFFLAIISILYLLSDGGAFWLRGAFVLMLLIGAVELYYPYIRKKRLHGDFFAFVIAVYLLLCMGLYQYANLVTDYVKFSLAVIAVFDVSFNVLKGRVTVVGSLSIGALSAFLASLFLRDIPDLGILAAIYHSAVTVVFAFTGFQLANYFKSVYGLDGLNFVRRDRTGVLDLFSGFMVGALGFLISVIFLKAVTI